ncbi:MAG: hypothetical protein AB1757_12010 [Acidobacteriota bacterium]
MIGKFIKCSIGFVSLVLVASLFLTGCIVSQMAARETAALREIQRIHEAELIYQAKHLRYGTLEELANEKLIDEAIGKGAKGSYKFEVEITADGFNAYAIPKNYDSWFGQSVKRSFFVNEKGIMTYADKQGRRADANDQRVEQ